MRPYEVMLILEAGAEESTVDGVINRVKDLVTAKNGRTAQVEKWGRKRFAYELEHRLEGFYALTEVTIDPTTVADLDRMLTLSDDVVRHKIIRIPESVAGRSRPALTSETADAESTGA